MYSIEGNIVYRDGEKLCEIDRAGFLNWDNAESQRYASPVVKFLQEVDRYDRETGMATWVMPESSTSAEPVADDAGETHEKPEEKSSVSSSGTSELCTVSELVAAVERISGEKAPEQSPFFGDKTPEVLAYLDCHADAVMELKRVYKFTGSLAGRKDI